MLCHIHEEVKKESIQKKQAFDIVISMAFLLVCFSSESTLEKTVLPPKKQCNVKKNCAVDYFCITKRSHGLHLEHEKEKKEENKNAAGEKKEEGRKDEKT
jgi:hypothetical protein